MLTGALIATLPAGAVSPAGTEAIPVTIPDPRLDPAAAAEIQGLFDEVRQVLVSDEFRTNLIAVTQGLDLRLQPKGEMTTGSELARMLRGEQPGATYLPAVVRWRPSGGSETQRMKRPPHGPVIKVKNAARASWQSNDPVSRSCPINTAAHELTHTITRTPGQVDWTISDHGFSRAPETQHFASYLVGSVAQCTWLQRNGDLTGTVAACVAANGTRKFSPKC